MTNNKSGRCVKDLGTGALRFFKEYPGNLKGLEWRPGTPAKCGFAIGIRMVSPTGGMPYAYYTSRGTCRSGGDRSVRQGCRGSEAASLLGCVIQDNFVFKEHGATAILSCPSRLGIKWHQSFSI